MGHLLITGATGLLGRYLMRDLMKAGVEIAVLVRPSRKKSPVDRIEGAMRSWEQRTGETLPRPRVLAGDISQPDFGLSADDIKWTVDHCDAMLHNAASLSFVSTGRHSEPWRTNVDGTKNVLEFCQQAQIQNFYHVSTAYVAGMRTGLVREDELDVGQEFANPYEESKVDAEKLVRSAPDLKQLTVFRPAIIIGDSETGLTFTYHNFYAMLQIGYMLSSQMGQIDATGKSCASMMGFNVNGEERKNLVPVNWVSAVMTEILRDSSLAGKTYHLAPRVAVSTRTLRDVMEEVLGVYGIEFYGYGERREFKHEIEELFFEQMQVYDSYWKDDPEFDTTNTQQAVPHLPCPHVDREMLVRLGRAAIASRFSWRDPSPKREPVAVTQ